MSRPRPPTRSSRSRVAPDHPRGALNGRRVAAGAASIRRFSDLLGLRDSEGRTSITSVGWINDHVELTIAAGHDLITLCIEPRSEERPGFLKTPRLSLWFQGASVPAPVEETIRHLAPERFGALTIGDLREEIAADPELGRPGLSLPSHDDYDSPTRGHLHSWGNPEVYADFFAGAEMIRHQLDSLDIFMRTTCVQHSDFECMCVAPVHAAPTVTLVSFPWLDRCRRREHRGEPEPFPEERSPDTTPGVWTTSLNERDVVLGGSEKLQGALRQAVTHPKGGLILVSNTCVPVVTGEDVESVVNAAREVSPVPLLFLTVTSQSMKGVLSDVLTRGRLESEAEANPPDPTTINLIGFPRSWATRELCEILAEGGVQVGEIVIPELDPAAISRLHRASLNVLWPNALWDHLYTQILEGSRTPAVFPPAPVGQVSTRSWLETVGRAVGRGPEVAHAATTGMEALAARYEARRQEATAHRLCFVARASQVELLADPTRSWGVPLLATVEEMGFALDIFIHVRGRESARTAAQAVHDQLRDPARHTIKAFETQRQMESRLRESSAQAVFSQHFFDWRVTSAGKIPFSLMHFEHGFRGALLTLERLLGLCRTTFYRRYWRHLRRTPHGQRASSPWTFTGEDGDPQGGLP